MNKKKSNFFFNQFWKNSHDSPSLYHKLRLKIERVNKSVKSTTPLGSTSTSSIWSKKSNIFLSLYNSLHSENIVILLFSNSALLIFVYLLGKYQLIPNSIYSTIFLGWDVLSNWISVVTAVLYIFFSYVIAIVNSFIFTNLQLPKVFTTDTKRPNSHLLETTPVFNTSSSNLNLAPVKDLYLTQLLVDKVSTEPNILFSSSYTNLKPKNFSLKFDYSNTKLFFSTNSLTSEQKIKNQLSNLKLLRWNSKYSGIHSSDLNFLYKSSGLSHPTHPFLKDSVSQNFLWSFNKNLILNSISGQDFTFFKKSKKSLLFNDPTMLALVKHQSHSVNFFDFKSLVLLSSNPSNKRFYRFPVFKFINFKKSNSSTTLNPLKYLFSR